MFNIFIIINSKATTIAIISGTIAGRMITKAKFIYTTLICIIIYPVCCHWIWNKTGFLKILGFKDLAGTSMVHTLGGLEALLAAIFLKPR